jgi:ribonuclease P protein component
MSHKFPKSARLLNAHDYSQVFNKCSVRAGSTAGTVLALPASDNRSRLGIIVAKKNVRLATDRNRIKRLVREYFRNHPLTASMSLVFMARRGAGALSNADVLGDLDRLWQKLNSKHAQIQCENDK